MSLSAFLSEALCFAAPAMLLPQIMDPPGAGDTVKGAVLGYAFPKANLERQTLKQACVYGTVVASFTVELFDTECYVA